VLIGALLLAGAPGAASAATYTVTTTGDGPPGKCEPVPTTCATLREAIEAVNKAPSPPDVIDAPAGTINLLMPLSIRAAVTIQGAGPGAATTVNGEEEGSVITIETSGAPKTNTVVGLSGLNLVRGLAEDGGAIDVTSKSGALTLDVNGGTISGNHAEEYGGGIAIETEEEVALNMSNEAVTSNKAGVGGGAIQFEPRHNLTLDAIVINASTFTGNTAGTTGKHNGAGGAIRFEPKGAGTSLVNVLESTFADNEAIGGQGGAIRFEPLGATAAALTARASTFSGNKATEDGEGGAIRYRSLEPESVFILENSTFTGNSATGEGSGGAIHYAGPEASTLPARDIALVNDTIVANTLTRASAGEGAGIHQETGVAGLNVVNTIIAGNTTSGAPDDCNEHVGSSDHSLSFGSNSCGLDLSGNPLLGALTNNGGPTMTMLPGVASAAIDAGDSARCPATDQRLVARPDDAGSACDIGAVESGLVTPILPLLVLPGTAPGGNVASVPPVLANLAQTHTIWRVGHKLAAISRKRPPIGTTFSFSLDQQASVHLSFAHIVSGRRVSRRCVAQTGRNRHKPSCRLALPAGTLFLPGHPGTDKVAFQGRVSARKQLAPGHYTVTIAATNAAGQTSQSRTLSFTVAP
jgi:hypothetical protein